MNLLATLAQVSGLTLISRLLGFGRDLLIAALFGATPATDAFVVAFRLPNLLRRLFAEGAFSQAFVPVLTRTREEKGDPATLHLIDRTYTLLLTAVALVTILGVIGAESLLLLAAPGFAKDPDQWVLAIEMTRWTFPYILFITLVAFASAILNTHGHFRRPAAAPILLNLSFILLLAIAALTGTRDPLWLAYAVLLGGFLQWFWLWQALPPLGIRPRWRWAPFDPDVQRILRLMAPALIGVSAAQLSLLLNTLLASLLPAGSLSWLYYADRLMELPVGLFGAALGVILLPHLSQAVARQDAPRYRALTDWGLRLTLLLTAPAALAFALFGDAITAALFMRGAFTATDAAATAHALAAYAVGLPALIAVKILAPACYAHEDTRTPLRAALISLSITQSANLLFLFLFDWGHWSLALAISLGAWTNALLLYRHLTRRALFHPLPGWLPLLAQTALALLVLALVAYLGAPLFRLYAAPAGDLFRLLALLLWLFIAAALYLGTLALTGLRWRAFSASAD
ncbi:MAG: murein biosynthesis integral membrane protein MurJ [Hydrogenophilus sp.]|nr:murein biosynthesis integral membrane protein MurJ [Hydrogenophilus sp.]